VSTLAGPTGLTRASSLLPDADQWRDVDSPSPVETRMAQWRFDTSVEANRRTTPEEIKDQRAAPRYSLRQINAMDDDALRQRLSAIDRNDNRPGWVKFLDVVDAPRNFVAGQIARHFAPEARRRALERGEYTDGGTLKVYGADLLRSMGIENRVVNGVGGFFVDVVTDPLSWIGGPLGGLKSAGVAGTVQVGKQGQRALNTGLKAFRQGRPIVDEATGRLVATTLAAGKAAGEIDDAADLVQKADYVRAAILGQQGLLSKGASRVGLGQSTRGGVLANDTFRSTRAAQTAEEAARIDAAKAFVGRYTNNRGIDLTGGRGGAEIAHIPFTDATLTVPSFRIPGLGVTPGRAAVIQQAVSKARAGNYEEGGALLAADRFHREAQTLSAKAQRLLDERVALNAKLGQAAERDAPQVARLTREIERVDAQIAEAQAAVERASAGTVRTTQPPQEPGRRVVDVVEDVDPLDPEAAFAGPVRIERPDRSPPAQADGQTTLFPGRQVPQAPDEIGVSTARLDELRSERARLAGGIEELTGPNLFTDRLDTLAGEIDQIAQQLGGWRAAAEDRRTAIFKGLEDAVGRPESVDDVLYAAEMERKAFAEAKLAETNLRWRDVDDLVTRATPSDVRAAQTQKRLIAEEARAIIGADPEAAVDDVLDAGRRHEIAAEVIRRRTEAASIRTQRLLNLSESDLELAEQVADAFHETANAAAEVAGLRGESIRSAMSSDQRMIADVARQALRVNDREMGNLIFAPFSAAARRLGQLDASAAISEASGAVGRNFGGISGLLPKALSRYRRQADLAANDAADLAMQYRRGYGRFAGVKGLNTIAKTHSVPSAMMPDLDAFVQLRMEQMIRQGTPQPTIARHKGSAAERLVTRLTDAGILQNEDLVAEVDALAGRIAELYRVMGEEAVRRGDFLSPLAQYAPAQLTARAAARVKAMANETRNPMVRTALEGVMDPSKPRVTNMVEFVGRDKQPRSFLLFEAQTFGRMTDDDIRAMELISPQAAQRAANLRDDVREFQAVVGASASELDQAMGDAARPLLPFELNEMSSRGVFDTMIGGRLADQGEIWETSAMHLLARRSHADRVAEAVHGFKEAVEPFVLARISSGQIDALRPGETARLATGQMIENVGHRRFRVAGRDYRTLDSAKLQGDSLFVPSDIYGQGAHEILVPDTVAEAIERMNDTLTPKKMNALMAGVDRLTGIWKMTTLSHPSWIITNALGNMVLTAMSDPEILLSPKRMASFGRHFRDAAKILAQRNTGGLLHRGLGTVSIGGTMVPVENIVRMADAGGVTTGGVAGDMVRQFYRDTAGRSPVGSAPISTGPLGSVRDRRLRALAEYADNRGDMPASQIASATDQVRAAKRAMTKGPLDAVVRTWFGVNGSIDDAFRLAYFMQQLDDGLDAGSAADATVRALLNFGDMTSAERNIVRPLVPFYAWARASLPNMLNRAITDPKQIAFVPKLGQALEETFAGEGRVPRWKRPRWLQETMAIQLGTNPETARTLQLGTLLPQEGAVQALSGGLGAAGALGTEALTGFDGQDFLDFASWTLGQTGPVGKGFIEVGTGRESFTGRSIGAQEGEGDVTLRQYVLGQIRPLRELGVGAPGPGPIQRSFEEGVGTGLGRLAVGGRFGANIDPESRGRALRGEFMDRENDLRKAIRRADDDGRLEQAAELRNRLMELYFNHLRRGGDPDDVPRWARDDLAAAGLSVAE